MALAEQASVANSALLSAECDLAVSSSAPLHRVGQTDGSDAPSSTLSIAPAARQFSIRRRPSITIEANGSAGAESSALAAHSASSTPRQISLSRRPSHTATSSSQPSSRVASRAPSPAPVAPINDELHAVASTTIGASAIASVASDSSSLTSAAMANAMALVLADGGERRKIVLTRSRRPSVQSEEVVAAPIVATQSEQSQEANTSDAISTAASTSVAVGNDEIAPVVDRGQVLAGFLSPPPHPSAPDSNIPLVLECVSTPLEVATDDCVKHNELPGPSDAELETPRRALFVSADRTVDTASATSHTTDPISEPSGNRTTIASSASSDTVTFSESTTVAQASSAHDDWSLLSPAPAFDHPQFFSGQLPTPAAADRRMEAEVAAAVASAAAKEAAKAAAEAAEAEAKAQAEARAAMARRDEEAKAKAIAAAAPPVALLRAALQWTADTEQMACYHCAVAFSLLNRRHHCRACGQIFCAECSCYRANVDFTAVAQAAASGATRAHAGHVAAVEPNPVRVCRECVHGNMASRRAQVADASCVVA